MERGQLVLRIVTNTVPSGWYAYFYDQDGHLIAEHDGSTGAPIREYVWLGDIPVAVIEAGTSPTVYWIHPDQLGRPIALTDATGAFVNETTWVAFGGIHVMTGSVGLDMRFPGQWAQQEGGLHYNWHRSYDPTIARYTQPDPLGLVDGPSRYAYVGSDPLQRVDPTGLQIVVPAPPIPMPGPAIGNPVLDMWNYVHSSVFPPNVYPQTPGLPSTAAVVPYQCSSAIPGAPDPCQGILDQIRDHEAKLEQYIRDPYSADNQGTLAGAADPALRDKIYLGRIQKLRTEIAGLIRSYENCRRNHGL